MLHFITYNLMLLIYNKVVMLFKETSKNVYHSKKSRIDLSLEEQCKFKNTYLHYYIV